MTVYKFKALHVPTGTVHEKMGEFQSALAFYQALEEYNRLAALQSCRREDRRLWVYYSDGN